MLKNILKPKLSYLAHLYKAVIRQHHADLFQDLKQFINRDGVVVDVGGHAGQFAKLFSGHLSQQGRVYSFEPGSYARSILACVKKIHGLRNLEIVPYALGSHQKTVSLQTPVKDSGAVGYGLSHTGDTTDDKRKTIAQPVSMTTLDDFVRQRGITRMDFIKIDIEGGEMDFFKGAVDTLKSFAPAVYTEINRDALKRFSYKPCDVYEFMATLSYKPYKINCGAWQEIDKNRFECGDVLFLSLPD